MRDSSLTEANRPLAVEPYDKEWGVGVSGLDEDISPFPRVNRLLERAKSVDCRSVDLQRYRIVTEAYDKYKADSQIVKMAKTLRDILANVEVDVYDDELLVGEMASPAYFAPLYPEFSFQWLKDEMEQAERGELPDFHERHNDKYFLSDEVRQAIREGAEKWRGTSIEDKCKARWSEEEMKGQTHGVFTCNLYSTCGVGHTNANYDKLLSLGFGGIREQVVEAASKLVLGEPDYLTKREFYDAALIVVDAAILYIRRYAEAARAKAAQTADQSRKAELKRMAANCEHVATEPPRDYWEAMQLWLIATFIICIESNGHSITYGRFDQIMYPFYKKDLDSGNLTREFMQELIECAFLKMDELCKIRDYAGTLIASGIGYGGTALDVGGCDAQGNDATNDLSYMVLDAHAHTRISNPWMGARISNKSPREFKIKLFNVIRIGTGEPKVFNDDVNIESLIRYGKPIEQARDYVGIGCVEPQVPGYTYGWHDAAYFDMPQVLLLTINNGRTLDTDEPIGLETGYLRDYESFDDLLTAFDRQMAYWCDRVVASICTMDLIHQEMKPLPYLSLLTDDCVAKGQDVSCGGARYNHCGPQGVGLGTCADSLAAIKQLVFEDGTCSADELMQAIKDDWAGHEVLQALVNSDRVHHYGNDDDYADSIAKFVMESYCEHIEHRPTAHGGEFMPGVYSVSNNVALGMGTPATPDGRVAGEPISDCLGAVHTKVASHDVKGPMAIAASISKLDQARIGNGVILNWKFSPSALAGQTGRDNLIRLIETYFDNGGMQSQFNVTSRQIMEAAQRDPVKYRDLMVRVAGYSAFFVQLSDELQSDLIGRTELSFD